MRWLYRFTSLLVLLPGLALSQDRGTIRGTVTDQTIAYYAERGRGGAGIVNTGYNFVCQRGRAGVYQMSTASDDMIPSMRRLTEAFHTAAPDGMIGSQINHAGRQTTSHTTGMIPEAPSPIPGPLPTGHSMEIPEEMSVQRIHAMVDEFAQAARRSKEAGFDLVEVHAAHGYLLSQFISPYSNIRADQYGGSIENRLRAVLEVLEACRGMVGPDYPLGVRINGDDMVDGGYTIDEYRIVAQLIERSGFADYISVSAGQHHPDGVAAMVAPMAMPLGFLEHLGAGVRSAVEKIPVFIVGRIKDPVQAENVTEFVVRYLIEHPDDFPNWRNDARNILSLFLNHTSVCPKSAGEVYSGAWAFPESCGCCGRSLWYGPLELAPVYAEYGVSFRVGRQKRPRAFALVNRSPISDQNETARQVSPSVPSARLEITGTAPMVQMASIQRGSTAEISPTKPRSQPLLFFLRARKARPSPPHMPTAG